MSRKYFAGHMTGVGGVINIVGVSISKSSAYDLPDIRQNSMKDSEILLAAIQKAEANGFVMDKHKHFCEIGRDDFTGEIKSLGAYQSIIFDHEFAKSFWVQLKKTIMANPDREYSNRKPYLQTRKSGRNWRWHLQQMVILENPIHYLEKFL